MSTLEGIQQRGTDILEVYSDDSTQKVGRVGTYTITLYGVEIDNDPPWLGNEVRWWLEEAAYRQHMAINSDPDAALKALKGALFLMRHISTTEQLKAARKALREATPDELDDDTPKEQFSEYASVWLIAQHVLQEKARIRKFQKMHQQIMDAATGQGEGMTRDDLPYRAGP